MKRKFFSLMVAACAALFSFSGLTGCSGGGDDVETYPGYLTYDGYTKKGLGILLEGGQVWLKILPTGPVDTYSPEREPDSPSAVRMYVSLTNASGDDIFDGIGTYQILEYRDREKGLPSKATFIVNVGDADDAVNKQLMAAFGFSATESGLFTFFGQLKLDLVFTGDGGEMWYTVYLNGSPISYQGFFSIISE